tara:strand:- start:543 stop:761 length:219 start_codon:yes stop_codon:yes gene_type:complete
MTYLEKETQKNTVKIQKYIDRQIKILNLLNETLEADEKEAKKNKASMALGLVESSNMIRANLSESLKNIING